MPNTIKKFPVKSLLTFPKDHIRSADTFVELMFEKSVCMFNFSYLSFGAISEWIKWLNGVFFFSVILCKV